MKRSTMTLGIVLLTGAVALFAAPASAGNSFGLGLHYLKTVGELADVEEFDDNDFGLIGALEFDRRTFRIDTQVEVLPDFGGSDKTMWQPQAYLLLGNFIYGGAGIGIGYLTDFGWQDPFYDLRAGVNFALGGLGLDVYATYRFQTAKDLEGLTTDDMNALTLAAVARFGK